MSSAAYFPEEILGNQRSLKVAVFANTYRKDSFHHRKPVCAGCVPLHTSSPQVRARTIVAAGEGRLDCMAYV